MATGDKPAHGMLTFVIVILIIAFIIAGIWFFFLTPEVPR